MDEAETERFGAWLSGRGIEGGRRVVREGEDTILVSKFDPGFAARLYQALERLPELFDTAAVRARFAASAPGAPRAEAWRLAVDALLDELGSERGLDRDQLAEIRAGTDSVAALLDAVLWSGPVVGGPWAPSAGELQAYADALARMDDDASIFTRHYGEFEGRRVENHCPGAPVARRLFGQAWEITTSS